MNGHDADRMSGGGAARCRHPNLYEGEAVAGGRVALCVLYVKSPAVLKMFPRGRAVRRVEAVPGVSSSDMSDSKLIDIGRGTRPLLLDCEMVAERVPDPDPSLASSSPSINSGNERPPTSLSSPA